MKKTLVFVLAVMLVAAFALPASAFESVFGGYWRTRIFTQKNFLGDEKAGLYEDSESTLIIDQDASAAPGTIVLEEDTEGDGVKNDETRFDTRTRLYYTAMFSDNFSFVNKFEFNTIWGDSNGGDIGADGDTFVVKNSYVDFRTGAFRHTLGIQGAVLARGFLFDDDFSGYIGRYQPGTTADVLIPVAYMQEVSGAGQGESSGSDSSMIAVFPYFPLGDAMVLNPYLIYGWRNSTSNPGGEYPNEAPFWLGADFDFNADAFKLWVSAIYSGGDGGVNTAGANVDNKGYLLGAGVDFNLGAVGLWLDLIYATGDDNAADSDNEAFALPAGASYYWSEIMGYGIMDNQASLNAPANKISNVQIAGFGADFKLGDKMNLSTDLWYAALAEKNSLGQDGLGIEVDVILTMAVVDNLNLDLVAAYLAADDATSLTGKAQDDPIELGARMSFSF